MNWEVELRPLGRDGERERICDEFDLLTQSDRGCELVQSSARGYILSGNLNASQVADLTTELLADTLVEQAIIREVGSPLEPSFTVLLKPGVMDPAAASVKSAARDLGADVETVRTFRRYFGPDNLNPNDRDTLFRKVLANDAIEQVVIGPLQAEHLALGTPYTFRRVVVPIRKLDDAALVKISVEGTLALTLEEMQTVQSHFRKLDRDPTDIELETIAQTWSEHCSHKTLRGTVHYTETKPDGTIHKRTYQNLLKETVFEATRQIRATLGSKDWCVSVFSDNAGIIQFDEQFHACFKVETHNHPSAIEPYGGANTGLGGVIRDVLGTGLGGKPICNTDVFCFAPPDLPPDKIPQGVMHPRRTMLGVVQGVKDYGNRMGIPTINGAVIFDPRYLANPLVYCGTVGLIPVGKETKAPVAGDYVVALGGRTGRDGIHGATFSSLELSTESEVVSGGAVQIGNAIEEKKVLDVVLAARDLNLFTAITDCGAGGFSSAVGEMAETLGARIDLEQAPLKYEGLSYTEIWISESQERMVLSVPPMLWTAFQALCKAEGAEAAVLGTFTGTGQLELFYHGQSVGDLSTHFLHEGRPKVVRDATWKPTLSHTPAPTQTPEEPSKILHAILGSYSVCSKEWIIRQYDHEVQGGSVIKPLVGVTDDGPSDAAVVAPVMGSFKGLAIGNGLNPRYDEDPYAMAAAAIDEALRNVVAVGADPARTAILDNFCWGDTKSPEGFGALVRAAEACRDVAIAFGTPFISGKDSLNNTFREGETLRSIPHTLLISALGHVHDIRQCVTMDFKAAGNRIVLLGNTWNELAGSHYHMVTGSTGGQIPKVDVELAPKIFQTLHQAIRAGLIRSCHDCSEGGLAVALAEMAFAGGFGADITKLSSTPGDKNLPFASKLFSESCSRFVLEVLPANISKLQILFAGLPFAEIGTTVNEPRLRVADDSGEWLIWEKLSALKESWQTPLRSMGR